VRLLVRFILVAVMALPLWSQAPPGQKYEVGTLLAVARHQEAKPSADAPVRYDVTVRVGDTVYVALFTPPNGSKTVEYRVGAELPVIAGPGSLKFSSILGAPLEAPILQKRPATPQD
jgi:hypothetical protein